MKGAMKCVGCGKLLTTAEEQQASIERFKESPKGFDFSKVIKLIILLVVIGLVYHFFSQEIIEIFNNLLKK